ncbi:hypothetical protein [Pelotalea chapellei]|uniref:Uncharacterized protein n=1 Tax=Pelotalea chapellei TaxID=44671 RepID=A0ABS5U957_9BACT|nr:hypothetical protein [Pelotalea chapellei]MBT1072186.1 hypothetical protein [Pelotalea chapellei]
MDKKSGKCGCINNGNAKFCEGCEEWNTPQYWCDVCEREVAEKRCPLCGLKARRRRETQEE